MASHGYGLKDRTVTGDGHVLRGGRGIPDLGVIGRAALIDGAANIATGDVGIRAMAAHRL